jgi:hypothetical protein
MGLRVVSTQSSSQKQQARHRMNLRVALIWSIASLVLLAAGGAVWYILSFADVIVLASLILIGASSCAALFPLLRRDWSLATARLIPLASIVALNLFGFKLWLFSVLGLYLIVSLSNNYLASCNTTSFILNNSTSRLGICKIINRTLGDESEYVIYDSSTEVSRPYYARDQRWKEAMNSFPIGRVISSFPLKVRNIFGQFYVIVINVQDADRG